MIARADDSSGIIGDACRRLLEIHTQAATAARTPVGKLIDWMMKFQFDDDEVDYFELAPVACAPALGEADMAAYRKRLAEVEAKLGPPPSQDERWSSNHSHSGSRWTGTPSDSLSSCASDAFPQIRTEWFLSGGPTR